MQVQTATAGDGETAAEGTARCLSTCTAHSVERHAGYPLKQRNAAPWKGVVNGHISFCQRRNLLFDKRERGRLGEKKKTLTPFMSSLWHFY